MKEEMENTNIQQSRPGEPSIILKARYKNQTFIYAGEYIIGKEYDYGK